MTRAPAFPPGVRTGGMMTRSSGMRSRATIEP